MNGEQPVFEELFNLEQDPNELINLAINLEYDPVLQAYRERCQDLVFELAQ